MKNRRLAIAILSFALLAARADANEWITAPSYYSHDPQTGERLQQYTPIGPFYIQPRGDYRRSGYRHMRSSIQVGGSSDNLHVVEEWGRPVRPYGEWRFPFRPNSVPYDLWGPPLPGFAGGFGGPRSSATHQRPYGPGREVAAPPGDAPPNRINVRPYPGYRPQPWDDGRYPPYDSRGPYGYPDLLLREKGRFDLPREEAAP
jgi:hypothetical protein